MKSYEMDHKLRKKVFSQIKHKNHRYKKLGWLHNLLWVCVEVGMVLLFLSYEDMSKIGLEDVVMITFLPNFLGLITLFPFYSILIQPVGEVIVPEVHKVTLRDDDLLSEWVPFANQCGNAGGTAIKTTMAYGAIQRMVWNHTLQRLEIHGEFQQKIKTFFGWEEKRFTHFTLNKKESVLHLYGYFPEMQDMMNELTARSGCQIENREG